jgi:nucleoside-diphosphate-sugar epimerase
MSLITVLGASGFIGSALVKRLEEIDLEYLAPGRSEKLVGRNLGDIIYCIGITADFRSHPFETVEAHVSHFARVLRDCDFESLLYLSSARVYQKQNTPASEEDPLQVSPSNHDDLYNISKVMGESLALASGEKIRVARLSNVYGNDFTSQNFLSSVIREAVSKAKVTVHNAPDAEKDYVSIHDVVDGLIRIAREGRQSLYNLASGINVSNQTLLRKISDLTGCQIAFDPAASKISFPQIRIDRIRSEFGFRARYVLDDLGDLIDSYRKHFAEQGAPSQ